MTRQEREPSSRFVKGDRQNSGAGLAAAVRIVCLQDSSRARCKRITFGDKLADTPPWVAETFKYTRAARQ